jgi:putative flippase GtrA
VVRFAAVSVLGTAIDFGVLALLVSGAGLPVVAGTVLSTEATIVNAYFWNTRWVFAGRATGGAALRRFIAFHALYAGTLVIAVVMVGGLSAVFGAGHYLFYKALTLPVNFLWNYLGSSRVIWRARAAIAGPEVAQDPP